jgi:hypothetical protein
VLEVEVVFGRDRPRHLAQPLEVGARHRVLGGLRRDAAEARQLAVGLLAHLGRHAGLLDPLAQLGQLALRLVGLAQLLPDRLHLLAEDELLLVLIDRLAHRLLDLLTHLEHLQLARQDLDQRLQALAHIEDLEQPLLVLGLQIEQRGDEVAQPAGLLLIARGLHRLVWNRRRQAHDARELADHRLHQRFDLEARGFRLADHLDVAAQERLGLREVAYADALDALDEHGEVVLAGSHHAQDHGERADLVQVLRARRLVARILLRHDAQHAVGGHDVVQELNAARPADVHRQDREREQHRVTHRHHRHVAAVARLERLERAPERGDDRRRFGLIRRRRQQRAFRIGNRNAHRPCSRTALAFRRRRRRQLLFRGHSGPQAAPGRHSMPWCLMGTWVSWATGAGTSRISSSPSGTTPRPGRAPPPTAARRRGGSLRTGFRRGGSGSRRAPAAAGAAR